MSNKDNLADLFDQDRNKAITLADEAIEITERLCEDPNFGSYGKDILDNIKYSKKILDENILPVSLLADFQNGKSTSVAAMADGHEISPCGKGGGGIRKSAVSLTIYHDPNLTKVTIHTYSKETLVHHILDCCTSNPDDDVTKQKNDLFDLDNPADKAKLVSKIKKEIEKYKQDVSSYNQDTLSLLKEAILILAFYQTDAYKRLIKGEFQTIESIQPFVAFSGNQNKKWKNLSKYGFDIIKQKDVNGNPLFDPIESLHVFIEDIRVPVHSEFMNETGVAVIDAPGTMASNEDTLRALKAANEAAVVLFILKGDKELGQTDREMLKTLKTAGVSEKVVFAINFQKNYKIIKQEDGIEESILATLEGLGYNRPHHKKILYYNAFLAVRAAQGTLLLDHTMDALTEAAICEDAEKRELIYETTEDAWMKTTLKVLRVIDADDAADVLREKGLCRETIKLIEEASLWREMISALRSHVTKNRACGILKDLGIQPVSNAFSGIEASLEAREKSANDSMEMAKEDYEQAKGILDKFSNDVDDLLDDYFSSETDKALANDYYDEVVIRAAEIAAEKAAPQFFEQTGVWGTAMDAFDKAKRGIQGLLGKAQEVIFGENDIIVDEANGVKEKTERILKKEFNKALSVCGNKWSVELEETEIYRENIQKKVSRVRKKMIDIWDSMGLKDQRLLTNASPDKIEVTGSMTKDLQNKAIQDIIINPYQGVTGTVSAALKGLVAGCAGYIGAAAIYLFILPADFIIPGIAEILLVVSAFITTVVYSVAKGKKEKRIKTIENDILVKLKTNLTDSNNKRTAITNIIKGDPNAIPPAPGISIYREFYETIFHQIILDQKKTLESNYKKRLDDLKKSEAERQNIRESAEKWRTKTIQPIREELELLLHEIEQHWG